MKTQLDMPSMNQEGDLHETLNLPVKALGLPRTRAIKKITIFCCLCATLSLKFAVSSIKLKSLVNIPPNSRFCYYLSFKVRPMRGSCATLSLESFHGSIFFAAKELRAREDEEEGWKHCLLDMPLL